MFFKIDVFQNFPEIANLIFYGSAFQSFEYIQGQFFCKPVRNWMALLKIHTYTKYRNIVYTK